MHITASSSSSFFFIISVTLPLLLHSAAAHNRRFLHQPFFPLDSQPPNSPSSALSPPAPPFFPSSSSLSPPSPPIPVSLPVNVSSITFPRDSKSKRASSNLAVVAIAAVVSAVIVVSIAVCLHFRKKRNRDSTASKTQRSDNSSRINYTCPGSGPGSGQMDVPKLERPSQTSSEFLYLGTLVDSYGGTAGTNNHRQNPAAVSAAPNSRKSDSPDLRPLPPLRLQSTTCGKSGNAEFGSGGLDDEEEEEVFYSPRGSLGCKESSFGTGSFSMRASSAVALQKFGSSSSFSSSSSDSASPVRSVSLSISPPVTFSPKEFRRKSPELVAAQAPPPFRPPPPPPPPPVPFFRVPLVKSQSPSLSPSPSPSPPSSSSPERVYSRSRETSPGISYCSNDENLDTPQPIKSPPTRHVPRGVPPPPPPPPPPLSFKNLGSPRTPTPQARNLISEPPVLVAPLKPMSVESPSLISPIQLPSNLKGDEKDDKTVDCKVDSDDNEEVSKPKLKPLHWDKVRASSGREMVWDQLIKSSSFKLNEEMIETLFVAKAPPIQAPKETTRWQVLPLPTQGNRVLDPKKSQNIAILLRALNVTVDEVCDSLLEGSADYLGTELLESLLKMAPTKEEERKLKEYKDDSPGKLGPAEKFLKAVLDIPFAFKRVEALLYISNFESETEYLKNSFQTLETACEELRNSRMFLKLLEAVLKTGNRMNVGTNRGDAHAFKLDTLLKLVDIKGADGKTTLLHFVVQEIIRSEGVRLHSADKATGSSVNDDVKSRKLGLQVVSSIGSELNNVKKAAAMDSEVLHGDVLKLSNGLENIAEILRLVGSTGKEENKFTESVAKFMITAEEEIIKLRAQESVALTLVKEITEYFHGNSAKEEAHPFRIFMVVRDFLTCLDRVCKEVGSINERTTVSAAHKFPIPVNPTFQQVRQLNSFSDNDSS